MNIWVRQLRISLNVANKIKKKHHITARQVRSAVVRVEGLEFAWDYHPVRGTRAIVRVEIGNRDALVVLYPVDELGADVWRLGSAYHIETGE